MKLRQFAERLAQRAAAELGLAAGDKPEQLALIRDLEYHSAITRVVAAAFHLIRRKALAPLRRGSPIHSSGSPTGAGQPRLSSPRPVLPAVTLQIGTVVLGKYGYKKIAERCKKADLFYVL